MLSIQIVAAVTVLAALGAVAPPAGTQSAAVPQSTGQAPSSGATSAEPPAPWWQERKPFDGVFAPPRKNEPRFEFQAFPARPNGPKPNGPTVICGTVVLLADPTVDPKMPVATPRPDMTYKMRVIQPPLCRG